jgi:hypothetical protein
MPAAEKKVAEVDTVTMDDGRIVEFPGKRKLQKNTTITPDNEVQVRLDWRNGETRLFTIPEGLMTRFAGHGAEQKLGDQIAGLKGKDGGEPDIDDCVFAVDELIERLNAGEWSLQTAGAGLAGVSVLAKALSEVMGKTATEIKTFLSARTHAEKVALRNNPKIKPTVERIEAEKAAKQLQKAPAVDTDKLLAEAFGPGNGTPMPDAA